MRLTAIVSPGYFFQIRYFTSNLHYHTIAEKVPFAKHYWYETLTKRSQHTTATNLSIIIFLRHVL